MGSNSTDVENGQSVRKKDELPRQSGAGCPVAIDALNVGMITFLPHDDLTFMWGNSFFFAVSAIQETNSVIASIICASFWHLFRMILCRLKVNCAV